MNLLKFNNKSEGVDKYLVAGSWGKQLQNGEIRGENKESQQHLVLTFA
jgi:hypothetical protein